MPTTVADEGQGATLTLGTSTWDTAALITSITPDAIMRNALETTHLGTTTARTFIPEDLRDNGGFTIEYLFIDAVSPPISTAETITITYPIQAGNSTGGLITGSGFCTSYTPPSATTGEVMRGSATFKWASTITFTAAT